MPSEQAKARAKLNARRAAGREFDPGKFVKEIGRVIEKHDRNFIMLDPDETDAKAYAEREGFTVIEDVFVATIKKGAPMTPEYKKSLEDLGLVVTEVNYELNGVQVGYETRELKGYKVEF